MLSDLTKKYIYAGAILAGAALTIAFVMLLGNGQFYDLLFHLRKSLEEGEKMRDYILSYGAWSPIIYVVIQILQVIFAPIPGEASGFLGGYLFGLWPSFIYSTVGLTVGSWLAFVLGRAIGKLFPEKIKESKVYLRFNHLVYKGGFVIPFILFIFPGFPKDSLSYVLGLSRMPLRVFLFVAAVGRIPGTLMLSLQGAHVYEGNYLTFFILLVVTAIVTLPFYLFRKRIMHKLQVYHNLLDQEDTAAPREEKE